MITLALAVVAQATPAAPKPLVLTHAAVIDARAARPLTDVTLVLSGGKIERIARGAVTPPAGADVIDLQGRYVLPGLIDASPRSRTCRS